MKTLDVLDVARAGEEIHVNARARSFLHHQVRNMVGALVYIGKGNYPPQWMAELLATRDRKLAPPTFSPDGLYLAGVDYDQKWELPEMKRSLTELVLPVG